MNTNNLASDTQCLEKKISKTSLPKHISATLHCIDDKLSSTYSRCVGVIGALLEGTKIRVHLSSGPIQAQILNSWTVCSDRCSEKFAVPKLKKKKKE